MPRAGASSSPRLIEVLRQSTQQSVSRIHTAMPGRVESYNAETQTANVKPLSVATSVDADGSITSQEYPVLVSVPVMFPRAGGYYTTYPIVVGDFVLLVFCERSVDEYIAGTGEVSEPWDLRMHDLSDAVALPGFYPSQVAIPEVSTEGMELGQEGGSKITIKPQGIVETTYSGQNSMTLNGSGSQTTLSIGDSAVHVAIVEALENFYTSTLKPHLETWLNTHIHVSGIGNVSPALEPITLPAWSTLINSTKVSIPDG